MPLCRLKKETLERLKTIKDRYSYKSLNAIVNKALDVLEGKELRKLEQTINRLTREMDGLREANFQWRQEYMKIISEKKELELKIGQLENNIKDLKFTYKGLAGEYEKALLENIEIKKQMENTDSQKFLSQIDSLKRKIEEKNAEIQILHGIIKEKDSKMLNIEQIIRENGELSEKVQSLEKELLELRDNNDNLIRQSYEQAKEVKFIRDVINQELSYISNLNPFDIKQELLKFKESLNRKVQQELEKMES